MDGDWMEVLGPRAEYLHFYAVSEASRKAAQDFEPRPSDVTVATYTKCGTTLMQQFIEMLRSEGKLDFDEITAVQPWIDFCHDINLDADAEQRAWPRVFKSHQPLSSLPRIGRVATVLRDPAAVLRSYYAFYQAKQHPLVEGKTLDEWALEWIVSGTWPGHLLWDYYVQTWLCWSSVRDAARAAAASGGAEAARAVMSSSGLLVLEFGSLVKDLKGYAPRVACWLDSAEGGSVDTSETNTCRAAELTDRDVMSANHERFDDHYLNRMQLQAGCERVMQPAVKVVAEGDRSHAKVALAESTEQMLRDAWREHMAPHTGIADWNAMATALQEDQQLWCTGS